MPESPNTTVHGSDTSAWVAYHVTLYDWHRNSDHHVPLPVASRADRSGRIAYPLPMTLLLPGLVMLTHSAVG
jgi:hypothetical protein